MRDRERKRERERVNLGEQTSKSRDLSDDGFCPHQNEVFQFDFNRTSPRLVLFGTPCGFGMCEFASV